MSSSPVLTLPGWQSSGPEHWQSRWEQAYGYVRVEQHDWMRPLRGDWMARLEEVLLSTAPGVTLVAHSLGCLLVAAWAAHSRNTRLVKAALLVAPGDVEREEMRALMSSWPPLPLQKLPFKSVLVGSRNDPYCTFERAQGYAQDWGSELMDLGNAGHINADSGLGLWPQGHDMLFKLQQTSNQLGTELKVCPASP